MGTNVVVAQLNTQHLPKKDLASYREISKAYDERQYKAALKKSDALLKRYPSHGETQAMRALSLNSLGRTAEAMDQCRLALRANIKSVVCWHIMGMIQRANKNYVEAVKAFRQAWKIEPDNPAVMRDLALVLMHQRDYAGSLDVRQAMLKQPVNINFNMLLFGYAQALTSNAEFASTVLEKFEVPAAEPPIATNITDDIALYKLRVLEQAGDAMAALKFALSPGFAAAVVDRQSADESIARLSLSVGNPREAVARAWALLQINPDNMDYAAMLLEGVVSEAGGLAFLPTRGTLDTDSRASTIARAVGSAASPSGSAAASAVAGANTLISTVLVASAAFPRCRTLRRLLLDALPADHPLFKPALAAYIRSSLRKGIPSLFADLRSLARPAHSAGLDWATRVAHCGLAGSPPKAKVFGEVAAAYYAALTAGGSLVLPTFVEGVDLAAAAAGLDCAMPAVRKALPSSAAPLLPDLLIFVETAGDGQKESPDVLPWAALLHARMQDEGGDSRAGVATLDAAVGHTPTVIDLAMAKARMLKHAGAFADAAAVMEGARVLDIADRAVNNKAVEYLLRAGRVNDAEATVSLFVRHDATGAADDPLAPMRSLQVSWFDLALGAAREAAGDLGPAIVAYHRALASQESFSEDGMDYHMYCLRNFWLQTHHDMLAVNQGLVSHPISLSSAEGLARCYLALSTTPALAVVRERAPITHFPVPELTDAAKAKAEKDKEKEKAEKAEKLAKGEEVEDGEGEDNSKKKEVFDPWGDAFLKAPTPLESARKYARMITEGTPAAWSSAPAATLTAATAATGAALGKVAVSVCRISEPSVMAGGRTSGWRTGLGALARMHALTGEVAVAGGKTGQATACLTLATLAAAEDAAATGTAAPGLLEQLAKLKTSIEERAAVGPEPPKGVVLEGMD
jgi:tetratricopeptide (TPR) repeat protein